MISLCVMITAIIALITDGKLWFGEAVLSFTARFHMYIIYGEFG